MQKKQTKKNSAISSHLTLGNSPHGSLPICMSGSSQYIVLSTSSEKGVGGKKICVLDLAVVGQKKGHHLCVRGNKKEWKLGDRALLGLLLWALRWHRSSPVPAASYACSSSSCRNTFPQPLITAFVIWSSFRTVELISRVRLIMYSMSGTLSGLIIHLFKLHPPPTHALSVTYHV